MKFVKNIFSGILYRYKILALAIRERKLEKKYRKNIKSTQADIEYLKERVNKITMVPKGCFSAESSSKAMNEIQIKRIELRIKKIIENDLKEWMGKNCF